MVHHFRATHEHDVDRDAFPWLFSDLWNLVANRKPVRIIDHLILGSSWILTSRAIHEATRSDNISGLLRTLFAPTMNSLKPADSERRKPENKNMCPTES